MSEVSNRSVARALTIVGLLAKAVQPLGLKEIADSLSIPRSSALSLLRALRDQDFVACDDQGRYSIGLGCFEAGASYARSMTPARAAEDQLRQLTNTHRVTSHFAVLEGSEVVYIAKQDPLDLGVRLASSIGARLPAAGTAVGKAILAQGNANSLSQPRDAALRLELELTLSRGYAVDDGQTASGILCVAAPVFSDRGCVGAIGVSYLPQISHDLTVIAASVVEVAALVSSRLGARSGARGVA